LANEYEIVVAGLRTLLEPYLSVLALHDGEARDSTEAVDVTLFDPFGRRDDVFEHARRLAARPESGAVVVFAFTARPWPDAILDDLGLQGFIAKTAPAEEIVDGIRAAAEGKPVRVRHAGRTRAASPVLRWPGRELGLTDRESELLALLPTGMTNPELARQLFVSENTVKSQLRGLYAKLGIRNRTQAATRAEGADGILGRHPV
jgi:DNA-binding NarL/FixJ family response regulator